MLNAFHSHANFIDPPGFYRPADRSFILPRGALHEMAFSSLRASIQWRQAHSLIREDSYTRLDPDLGWSIRPNRYLQDSVCFVPMRADFGQIEIPHSSLPTESPGSQPLQFIHPLHRGFQRKHLAKLHGGLLPRLEIINFGVAAYGTNQTYLRFRRDIIKYQPHIVLIGLILENIN